MLFLNEMPVSMHFPKKAGFEFYQTAAIVMVQKLWKLHAFAK